MASQFINVELAESTLALANQDLESFQNTVEIAEQRYKAGDIGENDYLKIKLQLLQFQTDVSAASCPCARSVGSAPVAWVRVGRFGLRRGRILTTSRSMGALEDFQAKALKDRPDLQAAQLGVTAANSQYELQKANGKRISPARLITPTSVT